MYNAHGLIPDPYLGSLSSGPLSCDCYGPGRDPWALHKVMIQLSFIMPILAAFIATAKSTPYLFAWGVYFLTQVAQAIWTLNLQVNELWADAIILSALMATAAIWSHWKPLKEAAMRVVHMK